VNYYYVAMDSCGKSKSGHIEADTEADAGNKLKSQGLFPTRLSASKIQNKEKELDRDDIYPRDRSLFESIFAEDEEQEKKGSLDAGMVLAVVLAVLFTAFRAKLDMEYFDLSIILLILGCFGFWRGFVKTEMLKGEKEEVEA
jgi:hypothetical protein